ncbi:MAG: inositol monophosphatase family protein [Pseudomonadota bacterium]
MNDVSRELHTPLIDEFVTAFTQQLTLAGRYALQLQDQLPEHSTAKHGDAWTSVLTDADIGVQQFIEAWILATHPDWGFFGEEYELSRNTRYFDPQAEVVVNLDPINGTRLYRDGASQFDLLASLTWRGQMLASVSHMPAIATTFIAAVDRPAVMHTPHSSQPIRPATPANPWLGVYQADELVARLPQSTQVFDMLNDYDKHDPRCCLNSLFTGALGGYLFLDCALLDVGATAFAVHQAGGIATDPVGRPLELFGHFDPQQHADLLVCMNHELHRDVVTALRQD